MNRSMGLSLALIFCGLAGCSGPGAQVRQCQEDKEQLLATIREQRDSNRSLKTQVASLETRLDQSEKELASLGRGGTRLSARPPVEKAPLPWRAPAGSSTSQPKTESAGKPSNKTSSYRPATVSLASLAQEDANLQFDAQSGLARLNGEIAFEEHSAELSAEARRQLDDVADWLKSDEADKLRVLVSGHASGRPPKAGEGKFSSARELGAARAQAVADYLDRHGIAEERLGVTGVGSRTADNGSPRGVEIFVAEAQTPLVGWGASGTIRR